jgi:hypothetical protein
MDYDILTEKITDTIMRNPKVHHTRAWRSPWFDDKAAFEKDNVVRMNIISEMDKHHEKIEGFYKRQVTIYPHDMNMINEHKEYMKQMLWEAFYPPLGPIKMDSIIAKMDKHAARHNPDHYRHNS